MGKGQKGLQGVEKEAIETYQMLLLGMGEETRVGELEPVFLSGPSAHALYFRMESQPSRADGFNGRRRRGGHDDEQLQVPKSSKF